MVDLEKSSSRLVTRDENKKDFTGEKNFIYESSRPLGQVVK